MAFGPPAILLSSVSMSLRNSLGGFLDLTLQPKIPIVMLTDEDLNINIKEVLKIDVLAEKSRFIPKEESDVFSFIKSDKEKVPIIYFSGMNRDLIRDVMKAMRMSGFKVISF